MRVIDRRLLNGFIATLSLLWLALILLPYLRLLG